MCVTASMALRAATARAKWMNVRQVRVCMASASIDSMSIDVIALTVLKALIAKSISMSAAQIRSVAAARVSMASMFTLACVKMGTREPTVTHHLCQVHANY